MDVKTVSPALQSSIDMVTGVVMRHGPGAGTRSFLCMATYLGDGNWAVIADSVYADRDRVYKDFIGDRQILDLWIHPVGGGEHPVRWGHKAALKPLAILHAPGSGVVTPEYAGAAEMAFPEYTKVWRNTFGGSRHYGDLDLTKPTKAVEGCIFHRPMFTRWNPHRDDAAIVVEAGMDYPGEKDAGGPVVDAKGRVAGMLLGHGYGGGDEHKGYYMPIDYIVPSLQMALAGANANEARILATVDFVGHRSNDVEFA